MHLLVDCRGVDMGRDDMPTLYQDVHSMQCFM